MDRFEEEEKIKLTNKKDPEKLDPFNNFFRFLEIFHKIYFLALNSVNQYTSNKPFTILWRLKDLSKIFYWKNSTKKPQIFADPLLVKSHFFQNVP